MLAEVWDELVIVRMWDGVARDWPGDGIIFQWARLDLHMLCRIWAGVVHMGYAGHGLDCTSAGRPQAMLTIGWSGNGPNWSCTALTIIRPAYGLSWPLPGLAWASYGHGLVFTWAVLSLARAGNGMRSQ